MTTLIYPFTGTMTLFNPSEAPKLHIELLPSNTIAVEVKVGEFVRASNHYSAPTNTGLCYYIKVWAPRSQPLLCRGSFDEDAFVENHCYDCELHAETLEVCVDDIETYYGDYEVILHGYADASSPCPCFSDGIGEVSWPCQAGQNGPEDPDYQLDLEDTIDARFLTYGIVIKCATYSKVLDYAEQQGCLIDGDNVYVTSDYKAANTFDGDPRRICWGESLIPKDLQTIEQTFSTTFANEDLLTFDSHNSYAEDIQEELDEVEEGELLESPLSLNGDAIPFSYEGAPMGIAVASTATSLEAFMLMAASGAHVRTGYAMCRLAQFNNVAVIDDFIATVWVSEELKAGVRLMFYNHPQDGHILLGQIPLDFDLTCKSIKPQLSDAEELVNS